MSAARCASNTCNADAGERWDGLDEQLQAPCTEIGKIQEHTGDVTARARETSNQAACYRITFQVDRDHWNARRSAGCRLNRGRGGCHDGIDAIVD